VRRLLDKLFDHVAGRLIMQAVNVVENQGHARAEIVGHCVEELP